MPWSPEDWEALLPAERVSDSHRDPCWGGVVEFLSRIPDRAERWILDLGGGAGLLGRDHGFGGIVCLRGMPSLVRARFHVALLLDTLGRPPAAELDELFGRVRSLLFEGGLFIVTFAAAPVVDVVRPMRLCAGAGSADTRGFHEIELQYRLHCAGFQGLRIRRFRVQHVGVDRLIAIGSRRASN